MLFSVLIESGSGGAVLEGDLFASVLMAALLALRLGERLERRPLEEVAAPMSSADP